MICRGPESWHPDPFSFYQQGAGPLFDMGPYYMTALVNLLGRCYKIAGFATKAHDERVIKSSAKYGERIPVNIETFVTGSVKFESGAIVNTMLSFDTYYSGAEYAQIILFGTEGGVRAALSTLSAAALLVFSLLYTPCVAAISAIKRELGRGWAIGVVLWQCGIAWIAALLVRLIGLALGLG